MPKTRKKRKPEKSEEPSEQIQDEEQVKDSESEIDDSEAGKQSELEAELKRLQDEYKRQKEITSELEREREKMNTAYEFAPEPITKPGPGAPTVPGYAEILADEPRFEEEYLGAVEADNKLLEDISSMKLELDQLKGELENKVDSDSLSGLSRIEQMNQKLMDDVIEFKSEVAKHQREVEKTDQKLSDVLSDLGFDESLDINKIPYGILVMVYETILNDIITLLKHRKGTHDTEEAVKSVLEDVRSHTSGGELFKFDRNIIEIPELRQYLAKKLISPKQIHITYESILQQLLEYVPGYTPKNFKAMIKVKSQEYAVTTATRLEEGFETLSSEMEKLKKTINKFIAESKGEDSETGSIDDELAKLNDQIANLTSRLDGFPEVMESKLDLMLGTRFGDKLPEVHVDTSEKPADEPTIEPGLGPSSQEQPRVEQPEVPPMKSITLGDEGPEELELTGDSVEPGEEPEDAGEETGEEDIDTGATEEVTEEVTEDETAEEAEIREEDSENEESTEAADEMSLEAEEDAEIDEQTVAEDAESDEKIPEDTKDTEDTEESEAHEDEVLDDASDDHDKKPVEEDEDDESAQSDSESDDVDELINKMKSVTLGDDEVDDSTEKPPKRLRKIKRAK
jgi:hypothetical protein